MLETIKEWKRLLQARKWMKQNASFLPAWHAYVGYETDLFDAFAEGEEAAVVAAERGLDPQLLQNWVDTGLVLGHLTQDKGRIRPAPSMLQYVSKSSSQSVGALLHEMMELHIPTLLRFPELLQGEQKPSFENERFGSTVAATSSLLEKLAFPKVSHWVKTSQAQSILDIGCGHGGYLLKLATKIDGLKLIGIEQNEDVVLQARKETSSNPQTRIEFVHGDFRQWEGPAEPVDLIMMNNILHYFSPEQRGTLLERARQLLSQQGSVSMITPLYMTNSGKAFSAAFNNFMSSHDNLYGFPTEDELERIAGEHGFRVKEKHPVIREGSWYFVGLEQAR
ncbi:class I SAM-dependent methyltransferase [Paenibacillus sp. 1P07SE]|uniref:class I SAM-dependent methyltransferase n=1 Tax=Paenibacillus sp. 1P07SE TaxID=3132209 RepID=UPI0039A6D211